LLYASAAHSTYRRTDTHWNKFGALIAYNTVVTALENRVGYRSRACELCGFAMSVVEAYEPAVVILAPVERQMFCRRR
jgi:hypothetical protein